MQICVFRVIDGCTHWLKSKLKCKKPRLFVRNAVDGLSSMYFSSLSNLKYDNDNDAFIDKRRDIDLQHADRAQYS